MTADDDIERQLCDDVHAVCHDVDGIAAVLASYASRGLALTSGGQRHMANVFYAIFDTDSEGEALVTATMNAEMAAMDAIDLKAVADFFSTALSDLALAALARKLAPGVTS